MLPNLQEKMPITEEETNFEEIWKLLKKKKKANCKRLPGIKHSLNRINFLLDIL